MTNLQNIYVKRVLEFRKKQHLTGRFLRGVMGGRFFSTGTPSGRWDGTPLFEETYTQWIRYGRQNPASAEIRPPVTDDPNWPPTGADSPWSDDVDADYFVDLEEPEFSWDEQIRQKRERSYLPDWGKKTSSND